MKVLKTAAMVVGAVALVTTGVGAIAGGAAFAAATGVSLATVSAVGTVAGLASTVLSAISPPKAAKGTVGGSQTDFKLDANAGIPYLMGRTYSGGNVVQRDTWGQDNQYQGFVVTYSGAGTTQGVEAHVVDMASYPVQDAVTGTYAGWMWARYSLPKSPSAPITSPVPGFPGLDDSFRMSGHTTSVIVLKFDVKEGKKFSNGVPKMGAIIMGEKVYDPRQDSTWPGGSGPCRAGDERTYVGGGPATNPWLHALTWAIGRWQNGFANADGSWNPGRRVLGVGQSPRSIDIQTFVDAANVADANGWTIGGVVYSIDNKWEVLRQMAQAGGGQCLRLGARLAAVVNSPKVALATVNETDLVGRGSVSASQTYRDRLNGMVPQFRSEAHGWEMVPASVVRVASYVAADGEEKTREWPLPLVQNVKQAGELTAYELVNRREFGPITLPVFIRFMGYKPGDALNLRVGALGLVDQMAIIRKRQIDVNTGNVNFSLVSETPQKHPFALGHTSVAPPIPNLSVPDESVVYAPQASDWTVKGGELEKDGVRTPSIILKGDVRNPMAEAFFVEARRTEAAAWGSVGQFPAKTTRVDITNVAAGASYYVAVSFVRRGVIGERVQLGPVQAGPLIAGAAQALPADGTIGGTLDPATGELSGGESVEDFLNGVQELRDTYGDTEAAAASALAAEAAATVSQRAADNAATARDAAQAAFTAADGAAALANTSKGLAQTAADNAKAAQDAAQAAQDAAGTAADKAAGSATSAGTASSAASQSATDAKGSASSASTSAATAAKARDDAGNSASAASGSASAASASATAAGQSATAADGSKTAAATSASAASASQGKAATSETNAQGSASSAASNASLAASSKDAAKGSADAAASSAQTAATSNTQAGQSATAAATSATNASTSAGNALTYRNDASTFASNAQGSAGTATTQAGVASTAARDATTAKDAAAASASAASGSAATASTKATEAGQSAQAASASANTASTKAGEASTSAGGAATSATDAKGSASAAATSATVSATARDGAVDAFARTFPASLDPTSRAAYDLGIGTVYGPNTGWPASYILGITGLPVAGFEWHFKKPITRIVGRRFRARVAIYSYSKKVRFFLGLHDSTSEAMADPRYLGQLVPAATGEPVDVTPTATGFVTIAGEFTIVADAREFVRPFVSVKSTDGTVVADLIHVGPIVLEDITSEAAAAGSATAASTSASSAAASQSAAAGSASSASTQANNASTSAGAASTSAGQAATSATNALGSANTASTQAGLAASARSAADGSASASSQSAQAASASANAAGTSASNAQSYRDSALASSGAANSSAGQASSSASAAAGSAAAAQQSYSLSASVALATANRNPILADWSDPAGAPAYWTKWGTGPQSRIAGTFSPYALQGNTNNGATNPTYYPQQGLFTDSTINPALTRLRGPCVVTATVVLNGGALPGSGWYFYINGGGSAHEGRFDRLTPIGYSGPVGNGVAGTEYTFSTLIDVTQGTGSAVFHAMTAWDNWATNIPRILTWLRLDIRQATQSEVAAGKAAVDATSALAKIADTNATVATNAKAAADRAAVIEAKARTSANLLRNSDFALGLAGYRVAAGGFVRLTDEKWGAYFVAPAPAGTYEFLVFPPVNVDGAVGVTAQVDLACFNIDGDAGAYMDLVGFDAPNGGGNVTLDSPNTPTASAKEFAINADPVILSNINFPANTRSIVMRVVKTGGRAAEIRVRRGKLELGGIATPYTSERSAVDVGAAVSVLQGVSADMNGRTQAYWQVSANAGGAGAAIEARAMSNPNGSTSSNVGIVAEEFSVTSTVNGVRRRVLRVQGQDVLIDGNLSSTSGVYLGSGAKWSYQLKQQSFNVRDGQTISYGVDLGAPPNIDFNTVGLDPLAAGETYRCYAESVSGVSFVARLRISTPGAATTIALGASAASSGPQQQVQRGGNPPSANGNFTVLASGSYTGPAYLQGDASDPGGQYWTVTGSLGVSIWRMRNGAWERFALEGVTVYQKVSSGGQKTITWNSGKSYALGTDVTAVGYSLESADGPATLGAMSISYVTQSSGNERSATANGGSATAVVRP